MDEQVTAIPKKTTRMRKASTQTTSISDTGSTTSSTQSPLTSVFEDLIAKISQSKSEFDNLQREIERTKTEWVREQKQHEVEIAQRNTQEEVERKREQETYQYNTSLARKRAEDEFQDKKLAWEKDLSQRKEELEDQKRELEELRKLAEQFESQKETAIKEAQDLLQKELTERFNQEKALRDQEVKAEQDLLSMRISNLEADNSRLNKEIEILKRSLDEATRQVKEIAVKVIESGSNQVKLQAVSQE